MINDVDAEMLESILAAEHDGNRLILVINSPGGHAMAAERIVNVCREYGKNQFEVLIPHKAKSAATMVALGASKIHMSPTAELGPVDPQVAYNPMGGEDVLWISAAEYIRSYDKLMNRGTSGDVKRLEPIIQQLARFDARFIEQLQSAQKLAEDISIKLLQGGMMKDGNEDAIRKKISPFLVQEETASHGRMIHARGAKKCGLKVETIGLRSNIWDLIWELYVRSDWTVKNRCAKLIESSKSALSA